MKKILKKYDLTEKRNKEYYKILKELKKFQENEDEKELELSISNLSESSTNNNENYFENEINLEEICKIRGGFDDKKNIAINKFKYNENSTSKLIFFHK